MIALLLATAAFAAQSVTIHTSDNVNLHAFAETVAGAKKGAVLVHMEGRSADDWQYLADRLFKGGVSTLAPDLRGHGANPPKTLTDADYQAMVNDVAASIAWLRRQGVSEITCVGASLGANLCVLAAAADPQIQALVLLSPGLNIKNVTVTDAMPKVGVRPVLFVASTEDNPARAAVSLLSQSDPGHNHVEMLSNAGHGSRMLNQDAGLEGLIQSWVLGTWQVSSGGIDAPKPADVGPGSVQTTGKKLPGNQ